MTQPVLNRRLVLGGAGAGLLTAASSPVLGQTRGRASVIAVPISGTATDAAGNVTQVFGTFTPNQFLIDPATGGVLVTGLLTLTRGLVNTIVQTVTMALQIANSTCTILDLTLGPLDLTLLGLHIHLDQVHLVITANAAGGLLGQLLCAIAGGTLTLAGLVALLNQILALFQ